MKLRIVCTTKKVISRLKRSFTAQVKILVNCTYQRRLPSRLYKDFPTSDSVNKRASKLKFWKEIQMANKHESPRRSMPTTYKHAYERIYGVFLKGLTEGKPTLNMDSTVSLTRFPYWIKRGKRGSWRHSSLSFLTELPSFMSTWHKLKSPKRRGLQLKQFLYKMGYKQAFGWF